MINDYFFHVLAGMTAIDWLALGATLVTISGFFEKLFDVKFVGRYIFRGLFAVVRFVFNRFVLLPFDKEIKQINALLKPTRQLEAKFLEILDRDTTQAGQITEILDALADLKKVIALIEKEVKYNGGGSLKDAVMKHREETLLNHNLLENLKLQTDLINLRLEILDSLNPQMFFRLSADLELLFISDSFLKFFGWSSDDLTGFNWEIAISDKSRDTVFEKWNRAKTLKARYLHKQFMLSKDGTEHFCLVRGFPRVIDKELQGFFGFVEVIDGDDDIHRTGDTDYLTGKSFWKAREIPPAT